MSFDKNKITELYPESEELMFEPMKIWSLPMGKEAQLDEMLKRGEYFASIKKDGAAYTFVRTEHHSYLFGRTVSKKTGLLTEKSANVPHIIKALEVLPANSIIVLEIYYPGGTSKDAVTILGCLPQKAIARQENNPIHAYAHDIIYYDGEDLRNIGALDRYKILEKVWKDYNLSAFDFLELAQPIYENILEEANKALANGEEGIVLRKKDGAWEASKRPAWRTIKIKEHDSVDLICIGFCHPTKEYVGKEIETWPYWERDVSNTTLGVEDERVAYQTLDDEVTTTDVCQYGNDGWIPVTKPYFYGWPSAIQIGAYDNEGNIKCLGTVSSGLTDEDKKNIANHPELYLNKVVSLDCMSISKESMTLRHPVFRQWREDKDIQECRVSDIFN